MASDSNFRWVRGRDQGWGGESKHSNRVSLLASRRLGPGVLAGAMRLGWIGPRPEDLCARSMSSAVISKCTIRPTPLVLLDPAVTGRRRGWRPAHSGLDASIAHLADHQKAPHLSKWSLSSTGGGALRWPSGSTLVRIDGPPSLRAAHPPSLTAGPATSDGTLARPRLQEAGCPGREWVSLNRSHGTWA